MKQSFNTTIATHQHNDSLRGTDADTGRAFWDTKPSDLAGFVIGYFGIFGSLRRGQQVCVIAECCGDRFKVVPITHRHRVCGSVRVVKRKNLALVQPDFFQFI